MEKTSNFYVANHADTWYTDAEYNAAKKIYDAKPWLQNAKVTDEVLARKNKVSGIKEGIPFKVLSWHPNYKRNIIYTGSQIDLKNGLPLEEVNGKWGTAWYPSIDSTGKILGGLVAGLLTFNPVGFVAGTVGGIVASEKAEKNASTKAKADAKAVQETVKQVKEQVKIKAEQKAIEEKAVIESQSKNVLAGFSLDNISDNQRMLFIVGGVLMLIIIMFLFNHKK